jgi:pimeloyl-ACP methyl ester carboxylesterase
MHRQTCQWPCCLSLRALFSITLLLAAHCVAFAQPVQDPAPAGPPDPEDISLLTQDSVVVQGTYWGAEKPGKTTVPVILLHGWEGRRQEFDALAVRLRDLGHAVLSLDLRGHGGSNTVKVPGTISGEPIDPARFKKEDLQRMVLDVQAGKQFLLEKNNEGLLNIEQLCIVGADLGALVALNYAVYDWTRPVGRNGKQGQDVKGVVLLSPPQAIKGLSYGDALNQPIVRAQLSTMIIVGREGVKALGDAKRLHGSLARFHAKIPETASVEEKASRMDLFLQEVETDNQGTGLLAGSSNAVAMIAQFIDLRLTKKAAEFAWKDRGRRGGGRRD